MGRTDLFLPLLLPLPGTGVCDKMAVLLVTDGLNSNEVALYL